MTLSMGASKDSLIQITYAGKVMKATKRSLLVPLKYVKLFFVKVYQPNLSATPHS
jgi:hypothetical protein